MPSDRKPGHMIRMRLSGIPALESLRRRSNRPAGELVAACLTWLNWQPDAVVAAVLDSAQRRRLPDAAELRGAIRFSENDEHIVLTERVAKELEARGSLVDATFVRRFGLFNRLSARDSSLERLRIAAELAGTPRDIASRLSFSAEELRLEEERRIRQAMDRMDDYLAPLMGRVAAGGPEHGAIPEAAGRDGPSARGAKAGARSIGKSSAKPAPGTNPAKSDEPSPRRKAEKRPKR
jgi:hypothetical protein